MKEATFKWIKLALDNWKIVMPIILFICSSAGLTFSMGNTAAIETQMVENTAASNKQIENIANYYHKPAKCTDCSLLLRQHKFKEH